MRSHPGIAAVCFVLLTSACRPAAPAPAADGVFRTSFTASGTVETIARLTVRCDACAWDKAGSEAVVLTLTLDDRAPVRVPIVRSGEAEYTVMLGSVAAGTHSLTVVPDTEL